MTQQVGGRDLAGINEALGALVLCLRITPWQVPDSQSSATASDYAHSAPTCKGAGRRG